MRIFSIHFFKKYIFLAVTLLIMFPFDSADAALCTAAPGGLCEGISNSSACATVLTGCNDYPRCTYSGTISGYFCKNNCHNTGQAGSCGDGKVCLCINQNRCNLCTSTGINLSTCNDNGCGGADAEKPVVTITAPTADPTYETAVSPIQLSGTASDNSTVSKVEWSNDRNTGSMGGSGSASGTTSWNIGFINLEPGQNIISVSATDGTGNTGTDTITVTYNPPSSQDFPNITLSENATDYAVAIDDPDTLSDISYAWGEKINVYFLLPFANEDDPVLSAAEQARYDYLTANFSADWDRLTANKHPLKFYFLPPFKVSDYSKSEDDWFSYVNKTVSQFESSNAAILRYPAIYVFLYPEPYFEKTYINMYGSEDKKVLAEIYCSIFNDNNMNAFSDPNEIISNVLQHEIVHNFAHLPNNEYVPGSNKYFWLGHPAGFSGVQASCDENASISDCDSYSAADSPTGTEGYYEAYSIISMARTSISKANFGNRDPELGSLVEMAMGLRSRYEDAPYMYYEGYLSGSNDTRSFNLTGSHDYNISSRRLFDYSRNPNTFHSLYWNISLDNAKTAIDNSLRTFTVPKSGQSGRPLLVYASDALNPGYYKIFSNNALSEKVSFDNNPPSSPAGLTVR